MLGAAFGWAVVASHWIVVLSRDEAASNGGAMIHSGCLILASSSKRQTRDGRGATRDKGPGAAAKARGWQQQHHLFVAGWLRCGSTKSTEVASCVGRSKAFILSSGDLSLSPTDEDGKGRQRGAAAAQRHAKSSSRERPRAKKAAAEKRPMAVRAGLVVAWRS